MLLSTDVMIKARSFYDYAWDTIEGCENTCWYCYARREVTKSYRTFEPKFFENRLNEPGEFAKPKKIFVNRLGDIMGDWVPQDWIQKVIEACKKYPQHTYLFMTKNPQRYKEFQFPDNCVLGVTIESPEFWWRAKVMEGITARKMASCEPLLGSFKGYDFSQFEYVVAGGLIGKGRSKWLHTVRHDKLYKKKR